MHNLSANNFFTLDSFARYLHQKIIGTGGETCFASIKLSIMTNSFRANAIDFSEVQLSLFVDFRRKEKNLRRD